VTATGTFHESSEEEDNLVVSQEMLSLALHEWPNSEAHFRATQQEGRLHFKADTPQGLAAAMRLQRAKVEAAHAGASSELTNLQIPPHRTIDAMLCASRCFADFIVLLHSLRRPMDPIEEARLATQHAGRLQLLPRSLGSHRFRMRLNVDEDGTGTLGRKPLLARRRQVLPSQTPVLRGVSELE
jgi:hypothetical protein